MVMFSTLRLHLECRHVMVNQGEAHHFLLHSAAYFIPFLLFSLSDKNEPQFLCEQVHFFSVHNDC